MKKKKPTLYSIAVKQSAIAKAALEALLIDTEMACHSHTQRGHIYLIIPSWIRTELACGLSGSRNFARTRRVVRGVKKYPKRFGIVRLCVPTQIWGAGGASGPMTAAVVPRSLRVGCGVRPAEKCGINRKRLSEEGLLCCKLCNHCLVAGVFGCGPAASGVWPASGLPGMRRMFVETLTRR